MNSQTKIATLGAAGGAVVALLVMFGASALGVWPLRFDGTQTRVYLLNHPEILAEMQTKLDARNAELADREQRSAMHAVGSKAFFDPKIAFVTGPADAKTTLVEFFDYNCPFCRASIPAVKRFYDAHKADTRFSFIEFPIKGPESIMAARASLAARKQPDKYLAFHFALMSEEDLATESVILADAAKARLDIAKLRADMADPKIDAALEIAHKLALRVKIDGTPTFIINGHIRPGAITGNELDRLIKSKPV